MQTTLLGLAIALILALLAALIGPYFIDWNQFRTQFEVEASRIVGAPIRVTGALDARLLPTPTLHLRQVAVGGANDLGRVRADRLDVEFSLSSLMRGDWRASELTVNGLALDLGLDSGGRLDWPIMPARSSLGALSIDRLNVTGRIALHDAASRTSLELNDIAFSGDVRAAAGAVRGDGNAMVSGVRTPFRLSVSASPDGNGNRVHLTVDPGERPVTADFDGLVAFDTRAPRFDGVISLASASKAKRGDDPATMPAWRLSGKLKANPQSAQIEALEVSYGEDERPVKLNGSAALEFGASPSARASVVARQIDADKLMAGPNGAAQPGAMIAALRQLIRDWPVPAIPAQFDIGCEQIFVGAQTIRDLSVQLRSSQSHWLLGKLTLRAPGATDVSLTGDSSATSPDTVAGRLTIVSAEPEQLIGWLQGPGDASAPRMRSAIRIEGDTTIAPGRVAIENLKASIDDATLSGRFALASEPLSRVEATLTADRLDLDASAALVRRVAGPPSDWPASGELTLVAGQASSAGREFRPLSVKLAYSPTSFSLDRLAVGSRDGVTINASGTLDRVATTGRFALDASAASLAPLSAWIASVAPDISTRLAAVESSGDVKLTFALALDKDATAADKTKAHAMLDVDGRAFKASTTLDASAPAMALQLFDLNTLMQSEISARTQWRAVQSRTLLTLLGIDNIVAAPDGAAQFEAQGAGAWGSPLRVAGKLTGTNLDAAADGSISLADGKVSGALNIATKNTRLTLFDGMAGSSDSSLSSRVTFDPDRIDLGDIDATLDGSRVRGRLAFGRGRDPAVDGELGIDTLDLGPALLQAIGAGGRDPSAPLIVGPLQRWRGQIAFQALRGKLPGGSELGQVGGVLKSNGTSLNLNGVKAKVGGGEVAFDMDARQTPDGLALDARVKVANADGATLRYRGLALPAAKASLDLTVAARGRSEAGLASALSGTGVLTLGPARIGDLNPGVFDVAMRASDEGRATDDVKLRQLVEPVLSAGVLPVAASQIPFTLRDGRLRTGATTLTADNAKLVVSGGYDISADQADVRATLTSTAIGTNTNRPEIQIFAAGPPDRLRRNLDVTALSSWLAVRTIDRETRRLDAIERGEAPLPAALPPATPPPLSPAPEAKSAPQESSISPDAAPADQSPPATQALPIPAVKPQPDPQPVRPKSATPPVQAPATSAQQVSPLPPPIEVRPAPAPAPRPAKPRPPLVLTPAPAAVPR